MSEQPNNEKYKSAVDLLIFEGEMLWTILNSYLVTNTILIGFIANLVSEIKPFTINWACFIAGALGLILIIPWLGTFLRNSAYYHFRMEQAKEAETKDWNLLNGVGEKFSDGDCVTVNGKKMRIGHFASLLRNKRAVYIMIILFAIIYSLIIFAYGPWWCACTCNNY